MKRIALFALAAAGSAALIATQLAAAENDAAKPAPSAGTPAKKEGCEMMKHGRHGHDRDPEGFRRHGEPDGFRKHGHGEGMGMPHMLNLTDDQKAKVKEIMEANRPKIEAIRKEEMAKVKAVIDESLKQIEPLLTPDQKQVLTDMEKLRQSREKLNQDKPKPTE